MPSVMSVKESTVATVAKPHLREPFASLEADIIEMMIAGLKEWRPDLGYPESHSDMAGCVRAILRAYDLKRRPIAHTSSRIEAPEWRCVVCYYTDSHDGGELTNLTLADGKSILVHSKCIVRKK